MTFYLSATPMSRAALAALLLAMTSSCAPTPPPTPTSKPAATRAAEKMPPWFKAVYDQQALLREHARHDAQTPAPWLVPPGVDSPRTLTVAGQKRTYLLHLPPAYDGKTTVPLIVALHGGGMDGFLQAYYSGLSEMADRETFIVVYPDAAVPPEKRNWNGHLNSQPDDVAFIRALIGELEQTLAVDRQHVMVTGGSAGGFMTYRMALEAGNCATAFCSFCGSFAWNMRNGEPPAMPSPVAPVSLIAIHGRQDKSVPYDGMETKQVRDWATTRSVEFWAKFDGCAATPLEERQPGMLKQTWTGGRDGAEVCLISLDDFGHALPQRLTDAGPIKGDQVLWDFLMRDRTCRLLPQNRTISEERVSVTAERTARLPAGAELRYTTDGSTPMATSPRYDGPLTVPVDTTVRMQAFVAGQAVGPQATARYVRVPLRPAQSVTPTAPGLNYAYGEGAWPSLPEAANFKALSSGVCPAADLSLVKHRAEDFAVIFTGFLRVPKDGAYTLSTVSDDGSDIWIGQTRVIDSDGMHQPIEAARTLGLRAGLHPITIRYLQRGGEAVLTVSMEGSGMPKRQLGADDFCHAP